MPQVCHSERSVSGVEESSHLPPAQEIPGAKILRLRATPFAQDDKLSVRLFFRDNDIQIFYAMLQFSITARRSFLDPGRLFFPAPLLLIFECGKLEPRNKQEVLP